MEPFPGTGDAEAAGTELAQRSVEALEQPLVVCDRAGDLAFANAAALGLWGFSDTPQTELVSRDQLRLEEQDGRELLAEHDPVDRVLRGEGPLEERLRLISRVGEWTLVDVRAKPLRDAGGAMLGAMLTIDLVDGELGTEQRLREYASDIEMLTETSRMLAEVQDPDEAAGVVCTIATGSTGAIAALLWNLVDDELVMHCHEGALPIEALSELISSTRAAALRAVSEARTVVEAESGERDAEVSRATVSGGSLPLPVGTAWHEPLTSGGHVTGALSILWAGLLEDLERPRRGIGRLAHHAATALERAELLRRLGEAARNDPLTGLANRRVWDESLDRELARAKRDSHPLSLVLLDIDHFKAYNDTRGHPQGDRLLHDAAQVWSEQLRGTDVFARVGGEEFAVPLPICPIDEACTVAERLRANVPDGQSCSLGVVAWDGLATASELYAAADAALYRAKAGGRNRVELAVTAQSPGETVA